MKKAAKSKSKTPPQSKIIQVPSSADDMTHMELSGSQSKTESTDASETDDDENEGLGDGKMKRSDRGEI